MMLLAILPAGLVALIGVALAGLLTYDRARGVDAINGRTGPALLASALLTFGVLLSAGLFASAEARVVADRVAELSRMAAHAQAELAKAIARLTRRGDSVARTSKPAVREPAVRADALSQPTVEIAVPNLGAAAALPNGNSAGAAAVSGAGDHVEVLVNLARRLQSLVHREIGLLDDLENEVEDPDLLKGLFQVDHLATRVRRYAENLAVLGGAPSHRQWTRPVSVSDVLRSAVAEIEQYSRVKLVPPVPGTLRGHAVADVVHLLAELVENATVFSAPQTRVLLRAEPVTAGLAIEVEDRGLGMPAAERARMNALLSSPDRAVPGDLLRDGRIGLYVVSALARRHNITVRLQGNIYGGTQAVLVLPPDVLGRGPEAARPTAVAPPSPPPPAVLPGSGRAPVRPIVRRATPTTGKKESPGAEPQPTAVDAPAEGLRPVLPQRRRQGHLAPELLEAPDSAIRPLEEVEHDPHLMASFQAGMRLTEEGSDEPDTSPAPGQDNPQGTIS